VWFCAVTPGITPYLILNWQIQKHATDSQLDGLDQRYEGSRIKNIINVICICHC